MSTLYPPPQAARTAAEGIDLTLWGICLAAGAAAGLVGGIWARLAMRGVALLLGQSPAFSLAGTLGILTIFTMLGALGGALGMILMHRLNLSRPRACLLIASAIGLLLAWPLYQVATTDVPGQSTGTLLWLMLLFVPVPVVMAWLTVYASDRLAASPATLQPRRLRVGWAWAIGSAGAATTLWALRTFSAPQRHPRLVSDLLGASSSDFATANERLVAGGLLLFGAYLGLTLFGLWRHPESPSTRWGVLLALLLPLLLLMSGTQRAPTAGGVQQTLWLPDAMRAAGVGALLAFVALVGGFRAPRWLQIVLLGAWLLGTMWLLSPSTGRSTEWMVWGILGVALLTLLIVRWNRERIGHASHVATLLLTLFVVAWLTIWAVVLLVPSLQLRGVSPFAVGLNVVLFWLPWLLLPGALLPKPVDGR